MATAKEIVAKEKIFIKASVDVILFGFLSFIRRFHNANYTINALYIQKQQQLNEICR